MTKGRFSLCPRTVHTGWDITMGHNEPPWLLITDLNTFEHIRNTKPCVMLSMDGLANAAMQLRMGHQASRSRFDEEPELVIALCTHARHLRRIPFRPVWRWHMGNQDLQRRGWTAAGRKLSPQENLYQVPWLRWKRAAAGPLPTPSVGKPKSFIQLFQFSTPSTCQRRKAQTLPVIPSAPCPDSQAGRHLSPPTPTKNLLQIKIIRMDVAGWH